MAPEASHSSVVVSGIECGPVTSAGISTTANPAIVLHAMQRFVPRRRVAFVPIRPPTPQVRAESSPRMIPSIALRPLAAAAERLASLEIGLLHELPVTADVAVLRAHDQHHALIAA